MPGLTPFDVSNLNASIAGVGNAFAERRAEEERKRRDDIELAIRQRLLDAEDRRMTAEEGRQNILAQGTTEAWLQGKDGGVIRFTGPQSGLDFILQQARTQGSPLQKVAPPSQRPQFGTWKTSTPLGDIEVQLKTPEDLDQLPVHAKKIGAGPLHQQASSYGPIQVDKQATDLEDQADQLEAQANTLPAGSDPADLIRQAKRLRTRAADLRSTMGDVRTTVETTAEVPPTSGEPATSGFLGIGAKPAIPPTPGQPRRTVTTREKVRPAMPDLTEAPAATAASPLPATKSKMVRGQRYSARGATWIWDGEKLVKEIQ